LLYYRRDLFDDPAEGQAFKARFGYDLGPPTTWVELRDIARHFTRPPDLYGYAFPGRYSGLFGTFFELVAMMGGRLFNNDLTPAFVDSAGEQALGFLRELYLADQVTPRELPDWHYDEVADLFRQGRVAMVTDWPSGFGAMRDPRLSRVADKLDLALYPVGPTGQRWVYAGGFTFAIPTSVRNLSGARALLRFLSSDEAQWIEAQHGAVSVRLKVRQRIRESVVAGSLEAHRLGILEQTVQQHMLVPPKFAAYPAVEDALWVALSNAMVGKCTVMEGLEAAAREVRRIVSK
jgi:multiple sugar transport system substrate-binding protein